MINVTNETTTGLSVSFNTQQEYEKLRNFLGKEVAYIDWVPQMATRKTALVFYDEEDLFSIGSVGCAAYQSKSGLRVVEFNDYFKL